MFTADVPKTAVNLTLVKIDADSKLEPMGKNKFSKRRKVTTCDTATQTENLKEWLHAKVVLEKLPLNQITNLAGSNRQGGKAEVSDQLSIQNPSMVCMPKAHTVISKPPGSYSTFVRPITNNEHANSTLVGDMAEGKQCTPTRRNNQSKKVRFMKPGPLSYKQRVLREMEEDMAVPVMLSEHSTNFEECRNSLNLETILEQINEDRTTTPELDLNFDLPSVNLEEPQDIAVQTGLSIHVNEPSDSDKESIQNSDEGKANSPTQPKTIQMHFQGITTTITSRSSQDANESSTSHDSSESGNEGIPENAKYIKIRAHTVHIHNHFYNPQ